MLMDVKSNLLQSLKELSGENESVFISCATMISTEQLLSIILAQFLEERSIKVLGFINN